MFCIISGELLFWALLKYLLHIFLFIGFLAKTSNVWARGCQKKSRLSGFGVLDLKVVLLCMLCEYPLELFLFLRSDG